MNDNQAIQLFEGKQVRIVWNEEQEKYYFSVTDIVQVLTDSKDAKQYIKRMRARDPELNSRWGTICTPTEMMASDGKVYKTQAADLEGVFRIIESIPSKKAEPVRQWLAEVGAQRIDQMIDPEQTFQMAVEDYRRQGYSDRWINERMRSIEMRKELTDEWQRSGIHEQKNPSNKPTESCASNNRRACRAPARKYNNVCSFPRARHRHRLLRSFATFHPYFHPKSVRNHRKMQQNE